MKGLFAALFALTLVAALGSESAEAARVGGGRSMGAQRAAPMQRQATPPAAAPQQSQQTAPATQPAGNRWLGPLAGLAAGLGLGWLLSQGGLGGMMGALLMALVVGVVVMMLMRAFARRRGAEEPAGPMRYARVGAETDAAPPPSQRPIADPQSQPSASAPVQIPAGFDVEGFLKQSKRNFLQLQEANDRADLAQLREVTTDEMFEALKGDVATRGARQQQTEIIMLNASLLEVVTEADAHWASVRFSGSVRESPRAAPETFEEVWNLRKPLSGETGWLLAGIQQVS
jgi:predicted lipid-binding transport protein (Tim44 family)